MGIIEIIEELVMAHTLCEKESYDCEFCSHER